jgi:hypothetical protein
MTRLKWKSVSHSPGSADLAIADFHLFEILKQKLQGIDISDGEDLKSEILRIFQDISSDELKSHSITGSKEAGGLQQMQGTILHDSHKRQDFIYAHPISAHTKTLLDKQYWASAAIGHVIRQESEN